MSKKRNSLLLVLTPGLLSLSGFGVAANPPVAAPLAGEQAQDYVVVFTDMRTTRAAAARRTSLASRAQALGGKMKTAMSAIDAGVVTMTPSQARDALNAGRVVAIEPVRTLWLRDMVPPKPPATRTATTLPRPAATQGSVISVGLDRVDQAYGPLDKTFSYSSTGNNVNVYVIDSGIRPSHSDLSGRVYQDWPAGNAADCSGHGTEVAGALAGTQSGVAKQARLRSVKIFDCDGRTTNATYLAAINWITGNHQKPAVVNASLTTAGRRDATIESALRNSIVGSGVLWVIAAGNNNHDACLNVEPNVSEAIRVGESIPGSDARVNIPNWYGSNYGPCVDLFAPGHGVTTSLNTGDTAFGLSYGTSLAAPLVTGAVALFLEKNPSATPAQVKAAILARSTHGQVTDIGPGSPNRLLYWPASGAWDLQTAGNFSGNGRTDLIWRHYRTGQLVFWNMNGSTIANSGVFNTLNAPEWRVEASGDLNNDGRSDLVWRNYLTGEVAVWYMGSANGGITLLSSQWITPNVVDGRWRIEAVADLNADGKADLLWRNYTTGQIAYWYLNGAQLISSGFAETVGDLAWRIEGAGDFNGDGKPDWVWRNYATGDIAYWYMNGVTRTGSATLTQKIAASWRIEAVADMNGDAKPDLVWRNHASGENAVWNMNGTTLLSSFFMTTVVD